MKKNKTLVSILVSLVSCCASAQTSHQAESKSEEVVVQNYRYIGVGQKNSYKELSAQVASSATPVQGYHEIQNIFCNGKTPRFSMKYSANLKPQHEPGVPLDIAAKNHAKFLKQARDFFDNEFYLNTALLERESQFVLVPYDGTLAFLQEHYTFALPPKVIEHVAMRKFDTQPPHIFFEQWGYDDDYVGEGDGAVQHLTFAASLAIKNREYIWESVFRNQTSLIEAAKEGGSTTFEIIFNFDLFCKYGISTLDLNAQ